MNTATGPGPALRPTGDTRAVPDHVPVLVVGGSLSGLSAAVLLAHHGVECLVVERHPGIGTHPRSRVLTARSGEVLRSVGLEAAVDAVSRRPSGWYRADTLADTSYAPLGPAGDPTRPISPAGSRLCDQNHLEPILLADARSSGARVLFGCELTAFDQDPHGVTARILDRATGRSSTVRCAYLLAADGTRSPVREALGIELHGRRGEPRFLSTVFAADLDPVLHGRRPTAVVFPGSQVLFARGTPQAPLWEYGIPDSPFVDGAEDEALHRFARERIRQVTGLPDVEPDVRSVLRWGASAVVAERFREGRVLLLGDAAHTMPVIGGLGGNTGIQDAHNLAWKLAAVLHGRAGERLLDTYDVERSRVAAHTLWHVLATARGRPEALHPETLQLGYLYPDPAGGPDAGPCEDPYHPTGRPGSRAPHLWLRNDSGRLSVLDLFGTGFTLLAGPLGACWPSAGRRAAAGLGVPLAVHRIGGPNGTLRDPRATFPARYGIGPGGAVLVRPDGYVARRWDRAPHTRTAAERAVRGALEQAVGISPEPADGTANPERIRIGGLAA
ncbi:FAD-dependent monooxygenase [Streptomyces sp. NPDC057939]|uniref:FAD-dependent monooxygenase n=1 Tax=Streptomyces sp. NPDC057939 TaxID=3346284 RepID=UPI0036E81821